MSTLDPSRLVFLDESGFKDNLHRNYGWAPEGTKPTLYAARQGRNLTVMGAMALDGVRAMATLNRGMNGDAFLGFLRDTLGPNLREGDIVVMDGPRVHRVAGVAETLAQFGAKALYLPPYSPELNPIEMLWSVLKAWVRKIAPRTLGRVREAVERTWAKVTRDLCRSWISHSGYPVLPS